MIFVILYYRKASKYHKLSDNRRRKRQADFRHCFVYIFLFFARALIRKRKLENCKDFLSKDSVTRLVIYDICYCITEMPLPQLIWQQKEEASSGFSPLLCPILLCRNKQLWRQWWTITLRQSQAASHYPIQANLDLRTLDLTFEIRELTFGFRESFPRNLLGCFTERNKWSEEMVIFVDFGMNFF